MAQNNEYYCIEMKKKKYENSWIGDGHGVCVCSGQRAFYDYWPWFGLICGCIVSKLLNLLLFMS